MTDTLKYPHRLLLSATSQPLYYDERFRQILEDHLFYLRAAGNVQTRQIEPGISHRFEYGFYKLLEFLGVAPHLWWITMRVNGYTSPDQFLVTRDYCIIPDTQIMEQLRSNYSSLLAKKK